MIIHRHTYLKILIHIHIWCNAKIRYYESKLLIDRFYIYICGAFNRFPDFLRWLTSFYDFSFKGTATAGIGIYPTKAWLSQLVNFKNAIWTLEEWYAIKFCFKRGKNNMRWKAGSTAMTQRPRDRVLSGSMLALPDPRRPDRANPPTNFWWSLFLIALAWSTCTGFPLDRQSTRNTMLRF